MVLLKLDDSTTGVDFLEYRDIEYYNQYKYRARVTFEGMYLTTWGKSIKDFENALNRARTYSVRKLNKENISKNLIVISKFLSYREDIKKNKSATVRTEGDTAAIFSSDLSKLLELKKLGDFVQVDITECVTSQYSGVKYFTREPKHKYRVYLRSLLVEPQFIEDFKDTLLKNSNLFPSKSLNYWLYRTRQNTWHFRYCSSSFSIDYDDESTLSYLMLIHGDMLGKKYKLEKRLDTE